MPTSGARKAPEDIAGQIDKAAFGDAGSCKHLQSRKNPNFRLDTA